MNRLVFVLFLILCAHACAAVAATVPQPPEDDNQEFLLDMVTNEYSRLWRETWDGGDNRFRFRLGSNNVSQWFLEEELKVAVQLNKRLRFRFYHARIDRYSTERIPWDVLEFEGKVYGKNYLSFYARPTFDKRESSLGFMYQYRRAVNQYIKVSVEWPGFMQNYSEHHRNTADSLLNVYTDKPIRFAFDLRERIIPNVWVRARGELVPSFEMGEEVTATGVKYPKERAEAKAIEGWAEYIVDPAHEARDQTAIGVSGLYRRTRKSKDPQSDTSWFDNSVVWNGSSPGSQRGVDESRSERGVIRPFGVPETEFDPDLFERTDDDTVHAWRETWWFVSAYAWVPVTDRLTLRGTLRFEDRNISIGNDRSQTFSTTSEYIVPLVGARYGLGIRRQYIIEAGFASEFRTRTDERVETPDTKAITAKEDFNDHRIFVGFEYVFGETNMIRFVEAFELDSEDRGDFKIHDHGFFQLIVGF